MAEPGRPLVTSRGSTGAWKRLRAVYAQMLPVPCWRCGAIIVPGTAWHLGHVIDRARGGGDDLLAPEHARCSRRAGGRLGAQIRNGRAGASRRW